jgi:hypothetical protein
MSNSAARKRTEIVGSRVQTEGARPSPTGWGTNVESAPHAEGSRRIDSGWVVKHGLTRVPVDVLIDHPDADEVPCGSTTNDEQDEVAGQQKGKGQVSPCGVRRKDNDAC